MKMLRKRGILPKGDAVGLKGMRVASALDDQAEEAVCSDIGLNVDGITVRKGALDQFTRNEAEVWVLGDSVGLVATLPAGTTAIRRLRRASSGLSYPAVISPTLAHFR